MFRHTLVKNLIEENFEHHFSASVETIAKWVCGRMQGRGKLAVKTDFNPRLIEATIVLKHSSREGLSWLLP